MKSTHTFPIALLTALVTTGLSGLTQAQLPSPASDYVEFKGKSKKE
jgi:hypothetical protein